MTIKRRIAFKNAGIVESDAVSGLHRVYAKTGSALKSRRVGKKVVPWRPRSGFIYSQVRAISARVNQNYDAWPSGELKKSYRTFVGKPIFVNHTNEDPTTARGVVVAARYVEKDADKYVECIMETDAKRFPKLGHEIRTGGMDSVSMGVEAGFTICSVCENRATDVHDMCDHIKFHKGDTMRNKKTGKKTLVYEKCYKLGFFELSYVFDPADETAVVSRVIAAGRKEANPGEYQPIGWDRYAPSFKDTEQVWHPQSEAYQDHQQLNQMKRQQHPEEAAIYDLSSPEEKNYLDPLDFFSPYKGPPKQEYHVRERDKPQSRMSAFDPNYWLRCAGLPTEPSISERKRRQMRKQVGGRWFVAFGETEAPEDIDTLRDESEDDTDLFHHWVQSPPELRAPNMDNTQRLDSAQEQEGLDTDRNAEDAEPIGINAEDESPVPQDQSLPPEEADIPDQETQFLDDSDDGPVMPINPPEYKKGRRTKRSNRMSRYYYAADDDDSDDNFDSDDGYDDSSDDGGDEDFGGDDGGEESEDSGGGDDIQSLLDEAEDDIEAYENGGDTDDWADDGQDEFDPDDDGDDDDALEALGPEGPRGDEGGDLSQEDSGDSGPPWAEKESYLRPTVNRKASRRNRRGGQPMRTTLASRNPKARHFTADENGYTDGGPYGVDDSQGVQEEVFISQVPGAEEVCAPTDDTSNISNSSNNLVARYQHPEFDPAHYQKMADTVAALPPAQRRAVAQEMVRTFKADNGSFNPITFYKEANVSLIKKGGRYFFAEDLVDPDKVDPSLSGTDVQDLKGDNFESLALEDVETQPKDASIHAFRQFDSWLATATGRTAAQHGNANYIGRAAASYCKQFQHPQQKLATLFPTLEYVLHEARKIEGRNAMRKRAEDKSLEVAAPDGRVDVEAPVRNVTDEKAQSSQFPLDDFAHNAGDQLADPVLDVVDGNAGTWAPDEGVKESSRKLAGATESMRCAEAYVRAMPNTYRADDRWRLASMFEGKLSTAVRADLRLLEAVLEDRKKAPRQAARKVTAASSRGTRSIPQGFGSRTRTAASNGFSANDPATDGALFI